MTRRIRTSRSMRGVFLLLLLCALAIRAAIPAGFMPVESPRGIVIAICTGQGATKAFLPVERRDDHPASPHADDGPCVFSAGLGGGLLDSGTPELSPSRTVPVRAPTARAMADLTPYRAAAPKPPAQGPPARA